MRHDSAGPTCAPWEGALIAESRKRLLGQVLVDGEFISRSDLERALVEQNRTNALLGEVLVRMGVLHPEEVTAAVAVQDGLGSLADAVRAAAGIRQRLGDLLLRARRITPAQLDRALDVQRRTGERLGEILLRLGILSADELGAVLSFQQAQCANLPSAERFRLGEILVATRQISREQLDQALRIQKGTKKRIGELLVEAGVARQEQVARGLRIQEKLITAALVAALSLAAPSAARERAPAAAALSAGRSAVVEVTAAVRSRTDLKVLRQSPALVVTDSDVARGYLDVPSASRIEVRSNDPAGYLLVFDLPGGSPGPIESARVEGLGRDVRIGAAGGWIPQPSARIPVTMELSYRFILRKDARPGTYAWPLALSARPL